MKTLERAREVFEVEVAALEAVSAGLGQGFTDAVAMLRKCLASGGKIVVTGIGKNLHVAEKISATLASTGSTAVVLNPAQAIHGDLGILAPGDVLLALSYSGDSEEIISLAQAVRRLGVRIIGLTCSVSSALGALSEVVVPIKVPREACPFNMAPTASTTATMAMGDALAMVLLDARGFKREDYARLHPGGAIGRALLLRATDVMRSGERLARVREGTTVRDALLAMTEARAGSACIVDEGGKLLGIFTDGDFRRRVACDPGLALSARVADFMTRDPVRARGDLPAVEALAIFEKHKIDDLPVVDADGGLLGSIDLQDLPGLKLF